MAIKTSWEELQEILEAVEEERYEYTTDKELRFIEELEHDEQYVRALNLRQMDWLTDIWKRAVKGEQQV